MRDKSPQKPFGRTAAKAHKKPVVHGIRPGTFYLTFGALVATNIVTLVGLLMAPDISRLLSGQNDVVLSAYEDRIAQLRVEVDRLHSRHYAQAGDINLQLQELAQQQELLTEQHQYVKQLADKAAELGIKTASLPPMATDEEDDADPIVTGSIAEPLAGGAAGDAGKQIAVAGAEVQSMMDDSRLALAALSEAATGQTSQIMSELASIGIKPKLPDSGDDAVGGPFLAPVDGPDSVSLVDDANAVMEALSQFKAARGAIDLAPVHKPVAGSTRLSSTFGNRRDPFTGRLAFHSGLDFAAPQGTTVLSAGYGKVSFVGQMSGYGNMVEITHGGGLVTRYGHLSAFLVKEGQVVSTGSPIARVGSTGRSTGPHLHFEIRRSDNAVDPAKYLAAGARLQKLTSV